MSRLEPEEKHSVDEQMIPFKGRSSMKQYMKSKPHKWGYKFSQGQEYHDWSMI